MNADEGLLAAAHATASTTAANLAMTITTTTTTATHTPASEVAPIVDGAPLAAVATAADAADAAVSTSSTSASLATKPAVEPGRTQALSAPPPAATLPKHSAHIHEPPAVIACGAGHSLTRCEGTSSTNCEFGTGSGASFMERLFTVFSSLPADGRHEQDLELDRRDVNGLHNVSISSASAESSQRWLTFEQLAHGLSWLLRGTSEKRAELCFRCFEEGGCVSCSRFATLLTSVYIIYETASKIDAEALCRVRAEAEEFVGMMYGLWVEGGSGAFDARSFNRAAHQHPLLVQAFQLQQLDLPPSALQNPELESLFSGLKKKNGVYRGMRPGAVCRIDETHFG